MPHLTESTLASQFEGPGTLTFYWKVSSEANYDYLRFSVDGQVIEEIHGEEDWAQVRYDFPDNRAYTVGDDATIDEFVLSIPRVLH